jgi:hypothetical protein
MMERTYGWGELTATVSMDSRMAVISLSSVSVVHSKEIMYTLFCDRGNYQFNWKQ